MEKLLVIGSSGLLGNKILELGKGRYQLYGTYIEQGQEGENLYELDVRNKNEVSKLFDTIKPDVVIDTHAITNLDYCETHKDETWAVNVEGARNVAEESKKLGAKYVFLSSDNVFDGAKGRYTEEDAPNPLNYYAKTKLECEKMLQAMGVDHIIARTAVLYGIGGATKPSFATWLINKLKGKEKVNIVTDQWSNPTLTDSLTEFMLKLCEKDAHGTFHVTGKEFISRYDFSKKIAERFGLDQSLINPITTPELKQVALRPLKVNMITDKVERTAGIKALTVDEGLAIFKKQFVSA